MANGGSMTSAAASPTVMNDTWSGGATATRVYSVLTPLADVFTLAETLLAQFPFPVNDGYNAVTCLASNDPTYRSKRFGIYHYQTYSTRVCNLAISQPGSSPFTLAGGVAAVVNGSALTGMADPAKNGQPEAFLGYFQDQAAVPWPWPIIAGRWIAPFNGGGNFTSVHLRKTFLRHPVPNGRTIIYPEAVEVYPPYPHMATSYGFPQWPFPLSTLPTPGFGPKLTSLSADVTVPAPATMGFIYHERFGGRNTRPSSLPWPP
jgi:hypothetical protein